MKMRLFELQEYTGNICSYSQWTFDVVLVLYKYKRSIWRHIMTNEEIYARYSISTIESYTSKELKKFVHYFLNVALHRTMTS